MGSEAYGLFIFIFLSKYYLQVCDVGKQLVISLRDFGAHKLLELGPLALELRRVEVTTGFV